MGHERRRGYAAAGVAEVGGTFGVVLDGKPVKTPAGRLLALPRRALADAVAAEWAAQGERILPFSLPLTRLAGSAIDLVAPYRAELVARTAGYGATDLLCYRAEGPDELVSRQAAAWQPLLDWAAWRFGAPLRVTAGVLAVDQPEASLRALTAAVEVCDDWQLTALAAATAACGSLILALALAEGEIDAETAFALSELDESYQIELWGEDEEARARRARLQGDIAAAERFLRLLEG